MDALLNSNSPVWLLVLLGFGSLALTIVGVWRKWKSGEIEDDGILLDRVNKDNINLRELNAKRRVEIEMLHVQLDDERVKRRHAEDAAEIYFRQLIAEGLEPKEVK